MRGATAGRCSDAGAVITDIAPALISAAKAAATGLNLILDVAAFLVKNFEQIASAALVLGSAVGAAGLAKAATLAGSAMNALKLALFDVKLAVAGLGKALAFLAANPIVLLVAGVTAEVSPFIGPRQQTIDS